MEVRVCAVIPVLNEEKFMLVHREFTGSNNARDILVMEGGSE